MKFIIVLTSLVALTAAVSVPEVFFQKNHHEPIFDLKERVAKEKGGLLAIESRSLSSKGKDALENFINKLPCGWPEAGIPPLAPYTKEEIVLGLKKYFAEIFAKIERFRIDGLDILIINKLKINYTFNQKVKFNLLLPRVVISGKFMAGALVDLMKEFGIRLKYDNDGDFELILENITFEGQFKYKMPYIFGSIKIYKFDGSITLGNVVSQINGIVGEGKYKEFLDNQIGDILMKAVGMNQDKISTMLADDLVPYLNEKLKGRKIWSIIRAAFGKKGKICYPPADPWK